jgi:HEAT repeat protein
MGIRSMLSRFIPALDRVDETKRLATNPDPATVDELEKRLRDPDLDVSLAAVHALRDFGENYQFALGRRMKADKTAQGPAWIEALGPDIRAARIAPILVKALRDKDCQVRAIVAVALGEVGPWTEGVVPTLVESLNDPDLMVRAGAARALGTVGPSAAAAIPTFLQALRESTGDVYHQKVAEAIGQIGASAAAEVIPLLQKAMNRPFMIAPSTRSLSLLGDVTTTAVPRLLELVDDPQWLVRYQAVETLGQLGRKARAAVPRLRSLATAEADAAVQAAATEALRKIEAPQSQ